MWTLLCVLRLWGQRLGQRWHKIMATIYPTSPYSNALGVQNAAGCTITSAVNPWNQHSHTYNAAPTSYDDVIGSVGSLMRMLQSRWKLLPGQMLPFQHITAYYHEKNATVYVFVVQNDQSVTIEDEWELFPSDRLMAQLRMLQK